MLAASDALIDLIRGSLDELPFPLAEEWELWLLDRAQAPLALLATAIAGFDLDDLWRLYPRVLDLDPMARARVEARLLRANSWAISVNKATRQLVFSPVFCVAPIVT